MNLKKIINSLQKKGAVHLRGDNTSGDIDFYLPRKHAKAVHRYLIDNQWILFFKDGFSTRYAYIDSKMNISILDFTLNLNYMFQDFPGIYFKPEFIKKYIENPSAYETQLKTIRYLFKLPLHSKHLAFLKKNINELLPHNFYLSNVSAYPFRKDIKLSDLEQAHNHPLYFFTLLKPSVSIKAIFKKLQNRFAQIFSSKSVCILGIDGAGKSTIIEYMCLLINSKPVYMGSSDDSFILSNFHSFFRRFFFGKFIVMVLVYLENWLRFLKVILYRLQGKNVFIDRHPAFRINNNKLLQSMNKLAYRWLFYVPKRTVLLYESPEVIRQRKPEASKEDIIRFQSNIGDTDLKIKNSDINRTIQLILERYFL